MTFLKNSVTYVFPVTIWRSRIIILMNLCVPNLKIKVNSIFMSCPSLHETVNWPHPTSIILVDHIDTGIVAYSVTDMNTVVDP